MNLPIDLETSKDIEAIIELQTSSINLLSSKDYNPRQVRSLIKRQRSARRKHKEPGFTARYGSKLIGFASLLAEKPRIGAIFVHPDCTRLGIGTKLVETIEKVAIRRNYRKINVTSSLTAVNFYRAMGYRHTHTGGFWSEGSTWIQCVNMQKQLIPDSGMEKWMQRIILLFICLVVAAWMLMQFIQ